MKCVLDMTAIFNVSANVVYKAIYELQIKPHVKILSKNYYSEDQVQEIKNKIGDRMEIVKYYPLKTTETYYIYQSKINKL